MADKLTYSSANLYWDNILSLSTQGLSQEQQDAIFESPAVKILEEHFIEILMNSIDETLQAHYANRTLSPLMEMKISIDNKTNPNMVAICITDNGRGFPLLICTLIDPFDLHLNRSTKFAP